MLEAYVFDFDGVILDTEWTEYITIVDEFARFDLDFDLAVWQRCVGTAWAHDWIEELAERAGQPIDRDDVMARRRAKKRERNLLLEILPGVMDHLEDARRLGLGVAVASSSPRDWVEPHLDRIGLLDRFDAVFTRDDVAQAKPAPDLYLAALGALDASAARSIAFEDSHNGSVAACAAGMRCVVVPNAVTAAQDFAHAHLVVESLDAIDHDVLRRLVS